MNLVQLLAINNAVPPFDDIRVRQAMNYAINRDEIIRAQPGDIAPHRQHLSPAMGAWYRYDGMLYDPQKAKTSWPRPAIRRIQSHPPPPASYPCTAGGEIIADQLAKVGIDLEIRVIEWEPGWSRFTPIAS